VDEHLGRFQICGRDEELAHALAEAKRLAAKINRLELELRRRGRGISAAPERERPRGSRTPLVESIPAARRLERS